MLRHALDNPDLFIMKYFGAKWSCADDSQQNFAYRL